MENFYKLELDADQMCRACLTRNTAVENIFCSEIVDGEIVPMPDVFETVTGMLITMDDPLPSKLCELCKQKTIDAYVFKRKCDKSDKLLRKILKVPLVEDSSPSKLGIIRKIIETYDVGTMTGERLASEDEPSESQMVDFSHASSNGIETVEDNLETMFSELDPQTEVDEADDDDGYSMEQPEYFHVIDEEDKGLISYHQNRQAEDNYIQEEKDAMEIVILQSDEGANSHILKSEMIDENSIDMTTDEVSEAVANDLIEYTYTTEDSMDDNEVVVICNTQIKKTKSIKKEAIKRYKVNCLLCRAAVFKKDLETHLNDHVNFLPQVISALEFYRCDRCRSIFISSATFLEHLADRKACMLLSKYQTDEQCTDYQFLDDPLDQTLDNIQMICCTKTEDRKFRCKCLYQTTSFETFHEHYLNHHLTDKHQSEQLYRDTYRLNHQCGLCLMSLDSLQETIFHAYYHQKQFTCPINPCGKRVFNTFGSLRRHLERDHFDGMIFHCQYCSKAYVGYELLKIHLKAECSARKMCCKLCDKKYFQKQTLDIHMRSHKNEKKFKCEYCPKMFIQSNDLKNHQRTHTGERPFHCPMCPKAFKTISCRLDHMKTHDEDSVVECQVCHKTFKSNRILRGHMRLHTEKSFQCDICLKKFHRLYHLKTHTKIHQENNESLTV